MGTGSHIESFYEKLTLNTSLLLFSNHYPFVYRQTLFPEDVKKQLLSDKAKEAEEEKAKAKKSQVGYYRASSSMDANLEKFFNQQDVEEDEEGQEILSSKPLAELYPEATVMFCGKITKMLFPAVCHTKPCTLTLSQLLQNTQTTSVSRPCRFYR